MSKKIKTMGIVSKTAQTPILKTARDIIDHVKGRAQVYVEILIANKLSQEYKKQVKIFKLNKANVDVLITLGGDGTVLMAEQANSAKEIPILGVNRGVIGFLTEVETDIKEKLNRLIEGRYIIEERTKLDIILNKKRIGDVLNDIVITTANPVKIQRYNIKIREEELDRITADGLIIATPTGSTAYAMSAGGPIVDPTLDAYEIVPICPFKLSSRPIAVPANIKTTVQVATDRKALISLDGQTRYDITKKDVIEVSKSQNKAYFIKFEDNFYSKIKRKLL